MVEILLYKQKVASSTLMANSNSKLRKYIKDIAKSEIIYADLLVMYLELENAYLFPIFHTVDTSKRIDGP